jgi:hypothetical protein
MALWALGQSKWIEVQVRASFALAGTRVLTLG